jgi:hypothetical protein
MCTSRLAYTSRSKNCCAISIRPKRHPDLAIAFYDEMDEIDSMPSPDFKRRMRLARPRCVLPCGWGFSPLGSGWPECGDFAQPRGPFRPYAMWDGERGARAGLRLQFGLLASVMGMALQIVRLQIRTIRLRARPTFRDSEPLSEGKRLKD